MPLTIWPDTSGSTPLVVNTTTANTYTLQDSDNGNIRVLNDGTGVALTIPSGLTSPFTCLLIQGAAGQVTVAAGAGATVVNRQTQLKTAGQYAMCSLVTTAANTYIFGGDTSA